MPLSLYFLVFRLANALTLATSFGPDEYWQSLEVAHRWVFGYGYLTWEWEECVALRGVQHPCIFAAYYGLLRLLQLDSAWLVAYGPRLLQAIATSSADLAVYRTAHGLFGGEVAGWAVAVQLGSWFQFYCMTRTYSNSMEAVFMALAMEHWLLHGMRSRKIALLFGSLCVVLRPTAAIFWLTLVLHDVWAHLCARPPPSFSARACSLLQHLLVPGLVLSCSLIAISSAMDSAVYGRWVFVPWNFARFNLLQDGGAFYGSHPWYWYATEGVLVTLGTFLPFTLLGLWRTARTSGASALGGPYLAVAAAVAVLSLASHKEYRFLLPFLPLASLPTAVGLAAAASSSCAGGRRRAYLCLGVFGPQLLAALFFACVHQRGAEAVMAHLRRRPPGRAGVFFLTPCHATPLQSHLHLEVPLGILDCPPGKGSLRDRFFAEPLPTLRWLFPSAAHGGYVSGPAAASANDTAGAARLAVPCAAARFAPAPRDLPSVFVVWGSLLRREPGVGPWLADNGYASEAEIPDGYWSEGPYGLETSPQFLVFRGGGGR